MRLLQEPSYKLDIVCGVMESCRSFCHPKLYHVNFLVSIDEDAANDSRERKLFFAKFWGPCFSQVVQLKSSSCSPVSDYFGCTGEPLFLILKSFRVIYMLISRKHHSSKSKNTVKHPPQHSLLVWKMVVWGICIPSFSCLCYLIGALREQVAALSVRLKEAWLCIHHLEAIPETLRAWLIYTLMLRLVPMRQELFIKTKLSCPLYGPTTISSKDFLWRQHEWLHNYKQRLWLWLWLSDEM